MNPIGFGLGGHGNGHNGHDDNSPNSSRGNPSSSRGSGTLPTEVSPEYARAGRQPGNPALFNVETYQPSLFAQGYMMNSGIPPYALKPTNVAGLQVFEVDHYYTTSRVAVETRYLRINAPGVADFTSIIKAELAFHDAVPLSAGKEQPEYPKFIRFDDLRAAADALVKLQGLYYDAHFMPTYDYALVKYDVVDLSKRFEGQVAVWVETFGAVTSEDLQANGAMRSCVFDELVSYGLIRAIHADAWYRNCVRFRVEFESLNDCQRCLKMMNLWFEAPDSFPRGHYPNTILTLNNGTGWRIARVHPYQPPTDNIVYEAPCTALHPNLVNGFGVVPGYATSPVEPEPAYSQSQTQNRVNVGRIMNGLDVRTTVMLRNIPNRMDWVDLKHLLDKHCFGDYDFIYLRIDFKTCSNVGYAFINFTSSTALIGAIKHIEHARWPGYQSSKRAEISYATIQGKEALVQKFRNSSVMREAPYCRPRTFISWLDINNRLCHNIHTGKEIPFPDPDNNAKLQRSIDNARNVGLFPPHSNGYTHDPNRSRSMYDHGTPQDRMATAAAANAELVLTPEASSNGAHPWELFGLSSREAMLPVFGSAGLGNNPALPHLGATFGTAGESSAVQPNVGSSARSSRGSLGAGNDRALPNCGQASRASGNGTNEQVFPNVGTLPAAASGSRIKQEENRAEDDDDMYPDGYVYHNFRRRQ